MNVLLRSLLATALAIVASTSAAEFPDKPVRLVVPFPAGGVSDVLARALGRELSAQWKQTVIVDNRPGANTIIGAENVARAAPDGYTLLLATDSTLSINPSLYKKLPYDAAADFVPVAMVAQTVEILVAHPSLPANNVKEFVELAKRKPGTIFYASFGPGSTPHLSTEAFKALAGIDIVHVPFKGVAEVMPGLVSGQVQVAFASIASPLPHIQAGRLKALGIVAKSRSPLLPDVPTFAESGFGEFDSKAWFGIVVPRGTPGEIVAKLARDIERATATPEFREKALAAVGLVPSPLTTDAFAVFLRTDRERYASKVRTANVKLD